MTHFLPNLSWLVKPGTVALFVLALTGSFGLQAQADLQLSDLTITPVNERGFDFSYTITNAGNQSVSSYALKLTFSTDQSIDELDYFAISLEGDAGTQFIGAGSSATKSAHFETAAVNKYLPAGTWYVIGQLNFDQAVPETNYNNNVAASANSITINPYTAEFVQSPTVSNVMNNSFILSYPADGHIYHCYYRYQFGGMPAPDADHMRSSADIFADAPLTISYLSPAQAYDVYFMGEARDGNVTDILKVQVTTTGTNTPTVLASDEQITLFPVGVGTESIMNPATIYGYHLAGPVVATVSQGFVVSLDGVNYAGQVSIPMGNFNGGTSQQVFVKTLPFDSRGTKSGSCTLSTTGASNLIISLGVVVFSQYDADFEGANSLNETGWTSYSVSGDQIWNLVDLQESSVNQRTASGNMAMQIDGTTDGAALNEDWLISPDIDLSSFTLTPALRFRAYSSGDGESLTLLYSADYPGFGDPRNATWFDTNASFPIVNTNSWKNIMVQLFDQSEHIRFAFVYRSTELKGSRWSIDDWRITDNLVNIPDNQLVFEDVSVGKASDPQSMLVSIVGFGSVTITASDDFQVSSDGVVYSPAVVVPETDVTTGVMLRVRYFPQEFVEEKVGSLTFTAAGDFSVVRDILVGRTAVTTAIEENRGLTGFLYPNPTNGDVHVDLSSMTDTDALYPVMVANGMGACVAVINAPASSLDYSLSNIFANLQSGVYFVIIKGKTTTWRTKLIRK